MSKPKPPRRRLDEILIAEGLISEADVAEALLRQKAHGGKFGSQVLFHRHIDESGLVRALTIQFGCKGVVLGGREIPADVLRIIPRKVCLSRRVLPYAYDAETETLKVACEDPSDPDLERELSFVAGGRKVQLYVAAELALNTALARYHLGRDISLEDSLLLEIPDDLTDVSPSRGAKAESAGARPPERPAVLLVTDEIYAAPLLRSLLERDGYEVAIAQSADAALAELEGRSFKAVFIRDSVPGDYLHVVDRARRLSPKTLIRFYGAASSLILDPKALSVEADLLLANCDLLTSLLSSKVDLPTNHGGLVGRYADRLCRRLNLPDRDRILIGNAGYIHDLARYYYNTPEGQDGRQLVQLTVRLLQSLNYSPVVLEMLRAMYATLDHQYLHRLPIELLGGNILTIADLAADSIPAGQPLSLDRFDALKRRLRDLASSMFLPEVVEAFIEMAQEEILDWRTGKTNAEVLVYAVDPSRNPPLELRLKNEGFRTAVLNSVERFVEAVKRRAPDVMILWVSAELASATKLIADLASAGVSTERIPTLVVTEASSAAALTGLLECGVEDIIARDDNLDFLVRKLQKLAARTRAKADKDRPDETEGSGARGRLADMNLMDLLQALGPSRKTVRITIHPSRAVGPAKLRIYLNSGAITFARYADLAGAEAVYEGLTWTDGTWSVDPIEEASLPPPNNLLSNESILMEGCRLLDEKVRAGQLL